MLVELDDLAAVLNVSGEDERLEPAIMMAEALCAAYVGVDSLEQASRSENITPPRDTNTIELAYGPLTAITSVLFDDDASDAHDSNNDLSNTFWTIKLEDGFAKDTKYNVSYVTGWVAIGDGVSDLPAVVKQAILIVASSIYKRGASGGSIKSESLGDWAATYADPSTGISAHIPMDAAILLKRYRRPVQ